MASTTTHLSVMEDDFLEVNEGFDHLLHHHHLPSRLSSTFTGANEEDDQSVDGFLGGTTMGTFMSGLSVESLDADEEFSDASDSDKDQRCYSLPATPPRRHRRRAGQEKDYVSENEVRKGSRKNACRRVLSGSSNRRSGASEGSPREGSGGGAAVVVITRPKGGKRSLCMDLEEVKACHDLGFELEHQQMLEVLPRLPAASGRTLDHQSSSGGNSPISSWRISSPG